MVHVASLSSNANVYLFCRFQIASLKVDDASTAVPSKYVDFANAFSLDLATELLEYIKINNDTMNLIKGQ